MLIVMSPTEAKLGFIMIKVSFTAALDFFSEKINVKRNSFLVVVLQNYFTRRKGHF